MTDLSYTSAVDMARRIREGSLSPLDVVEAHFDRIEACDDSDFDDQDLVSVYSTSDIIASFDTI